MATTKMIIIIIIVIIITIITIIIIITIITPYIEPKTSHNERNQTLE